MSIIARLISFISSICLSVCFPLRVFFYVWVASLCELMVLNSRFYFCCIWNVCVTFAWQLDEKTAAERCRMSTLNLLLLLLRGQRFLDFFLLCFLQRTAQLHTRYVACRTAGWETTDCLSSPLLTIRTADLTALSTTPCQEIPHRLSVNTDDLFFFHTFSSLCTTLLLPSRQMSLIEHYTTATRGRGTMRRKKIRWEDMRFLRLCFQFPLCRDSLPYPCV